MNELQFNVLLRKIWENNFPIKPVRNYKSNYNWLKCIKTRKIFQTSNSFENEEEFKNWIVPKLKHLFGPVNLPEQQFLPVDILFMKKNVLYLTELKYCKNLLSIRVMNAAIKQLQSYHEALISFLNFLNIKIEIKIIVLISYSDGQNKRFVQIIEMNLDRLKKTFYELNGEKNWEKNRRFVIRLSKTIF